MHIVECIVGHSSTQLPPKQEQESGHTHRWTLFVKPANKEYDDFLDNKLISKVKFKIHDTFAQPIRWVYKPPFEIADTGYASFTAFITIYLNLNNEKPRVIPYELTLFTGQHDSQSDLQKLVIRSEEIPPGYLEQIKKYKTKKRKASMISSSNDEKSPQENQHHHHRKSQKLTPNEEEKGKKSRETEEKKEKKEKKKELREPREKVKSPEELTKKLNECEDPYVIYKASEYLLGLPDTKLSSTTFKLSFDLSKCNTEMLLEIGRILKSKKSSKHRS